MPPDDKSAVAKTAHTAGPSARYPRTGIGYDSHRFAAGGPIILGGISIPSDVHLAGHSDGDAIAHALTDAILGACGESDIGTLFPDTDSANAGRDSIEMLRIAVSRAADHGFVVGNADVTVIAEKPKLSPHRDAIVAILGRTIGGHVNVKAKTNEGMGWIGRGEGLACIAVATLYPREGAIRA